MTKAKKILQNIVEEEAAQAVALGTVAALGTTPNVVLGVSGPKKSSKSKKEQTKPIEESSKIRLDFDRMTPEELMGVWQKSQSGLAMARDLFPEQPKGYLRACRDLGHLAANLATLQNNPRKKEYELICYDIYRKLPSWAKEVIKIGF